MRRDEVLSSLRKAVMEHCQELSRPKSWEGGWPHSLGEFARLVEVFQDRLVRYAFRRLRNLHEAEDVAQEVFLRAYNEGARRKKITYVSAYLYRVASNLCTDRLRKRGRQRQNVSLEQAGNLAVLTDHRDASQATAVTEELRRIEAMLSRISQRQAEVIWLRVFDELRFREIADVLDCPVSTVKARLRYGLEKLRKILPQEREVLR